MNLSIETDCSVCGGHVEITDFYTQGAFGARIKITPCPRCKEKMKNEVEQAFREKLNMLNTTVIENIISEAKKETNI